MSKPEVTIYTTASCAYCHAEKNFLKEEGVAYKEVPVDVDQNAAREMIEKSGQMGVPFTIVKKDGKEEGIVGFDQQRLTAALGL